EQLPGLVLEQRVVPPRDVGGARVRRRPPEEDRAGDVVAEHLLPAEDRLERADGAQDPRDAHGAAAREGRELGDGDGAHDGEHTLARAAGSGVPSSIAAAGCGEEAVVGYNVQAYAIDLERLRAAVGSGDEALLATLTREHAHALEEIDRLDPPGVISAADAL